MAQKYSFDHKLYKVKPGEKLVLRNHNPQNSGGIKNRDEAQKALVEDISELTSAQEVLYANGSNSVIIILQAMDAAGKDGIVKHVMSGINAQGCSVYSFKAPTEEERKHHFLWRPMQVIPPAGRIAIFNRSYYEEVLVTKIHPSFLETQFIPKELKADGYSKLWETRYREINDFEKWLTESGVVVIKFFLNISKEEQKQRLLARMDDPTKNWKFSAADIKERDYWKDYQKAYEAMLRNTSTDYAPWYIIPADRKWYSRALVADIITQRIKKLKLKYPKLSPEAMAEMKEMRAALVKA